MYSLYSLAMAVDAVSNVNGGALVEVVRATAAGGFVPVSRGPGTRHKERGFRGNLQRPPTCGSQNNYILSVVFISTGRSPHSSTSRPAFTGLSLSLSFSFSEVGLVLLWLTADLPRRVVLGEW